MIPVLKPSCTEREIEAVAAVLRSGWWGNGPACAEFERQLAARYGRAHCVTVNSATAALHLALTVAGVRRGDMVVVPALTFVSTALAVLYCGARPIFADVDADTLCVDYRDDCWSTQGGLPVRAGVSVDFAGYPAGPGWAPPSLVQDAAHSAGGTSWGALTCLSFHPVKNLATGDGGAILLDDDDQAERLRRLRWCGIDRNTWERADRPRYAWDYEIAELGYKYHWNDIQAAIALVQLDRLTAMNARRRAIAARYTAALWPIAQVPAEHPDHTWHLYVLRVAPAQRQGLIDALAAEGIAAGVHYRPVTEFALFSQPTPPVTAREWQRCVSLPIYPDLTDEQQGRVIEVVQRTLARIAA